MAVEEAERETLISWRGEEYLGWRQLRKPRTL